MTEKSSSKPLFLSKILNYGTCISAWKLFLTWLSPLYNVLCSEFIYRAHSMKTLKWWVIHSIDLPPGSHSTHWLDLVKSQLGLLTKDQPIRLLISLFSPLYHRKFYLYRILLIFSDWFGSFLKIKIYSSLYVCVLFIYTGAVILLLIC